MPFVLTCSILTPCLILLYLKACYHNNKSYQNGQTWINRQWGNCFECTCVRGQAKCEKAMQCSANCPNPVYEPDKCCPTCRECWVNESQSLSFYLSYFSMYQNCHDRTLRDKITIKHLSVWNKVGVFLGKQKALFDKKEYKAIQVCTYPSFSKVRPRHQR